MKYPPSVCLKKLLKKGLWKMPFLLPDRYFLTRYCGGKIYLNLGESVMMLDRALGVYEYWKTELFINVVIEGMTIVDMGANKGYFSLLFAKLMNDRGKVLSFEPDPDNCFWFRESIQANGYRCIKLFECALANEEGIATFYRGKKSGLGSLFRRSGTKEEAITVRTRKLDDVLKDEGMNEVDLIKMDVQGADLLVLEGAKRTLKRGNARLAMDVDLESSGERNQLFDFLKLCGFEIFRIGKELTPIKKIDEKTKEIYAMKLSAI